MVKEFFRPTKGKIITTLVMFFSSFAVLIAYHFFFDCFAIIGTCPPPSFTETAIDAAMKFPGENITRYLFALTGFSGEAYLPAEVLKEYPPPILQNILMVIYVISQLLFYYLLVCIFNPYFYSSIGKEEELVIEKDK